MSTYAIGDVQGCLPPLKALLEKINYNPAYDQLWFTGDLVNRGYHSLDTLRFIKALPPHTIVVLGNHDLALLAMANGSLPLHPKEAFQEILDAPDREDLLAWLKTRPFLHHDPLLGFTMTHAGIYPFWDLQTAQFLANELQMLLKEHAKDYLDNLFGNEPRIWDSNLSGWDRARFVSNAFTRMRFCTETGALDLTSKGNPALHPELIPWFAFEERKSVKEKIIFGHWAALYPHDTTKNIYAIDSGCVWGNCLTSFCLETEQKVSVDCKDYINQPLSL